MLIVMLYFEQNYNDKTAQDFPPIRDTEDIETCKYDVQPNEELSKLTRLYVVTPTFDRLEQTAELTRLSQTLMQVQNLVWIVAEDSSKCAPKVHDIVSKLKSYVHLAAPMPAKFKEEASVREIGLPRGVAGRMMSLNWLLKNTNENEKATVYFADDDNAYSLELFEELRKVKKIGMFPVGLIQPYGVSSPIVNVKGKVVGFVGGHSRKFPVDMAGFATSLKLIHHKQPVMPYRSTYEEEGYIKSLNVE